MRSVTLTNAEDGKGENLKAITAFAVQEVRKEQDRDPASLRVKFDTII